jgi:NAD(P)-dependent dehydrogenase (short-subunit alcohol dehydrogenase family)
VWLLGRDGEPLALAAAELSGAAVEVGLLDANDVGSHRQAIERAFADADGFDVVVIALGVLGAQAGLDADPDEAIEVMRVNFLGAGSLLLECFRQLRRRGAGALVLLSSVAVERPPRLQPDLRSGQGGPRRARPGSLRRDRVERGARARRTPGIRQDPNDRRPGARG